MAIFKKRNKSKAQKGKTAVRISIRTKFSILVTCSILISSLSILYFILPKTTAILTDYTDAIMKELTIAKGNSIDNALAEIQSTMHSFETSGSISAFLGGTVLNPSASQTEISKYKTEHTYISNCSLVDATGKIVLSYDKGLVGKDVSGLACVADTASGKAAVSSGVIPSFYDNSNIMAFTIPIFALNKYVGMVISTTNVNDLFHSIQTIQIMNTENSYAYDLDDTGMILYHPDSKRIGTTIDIPEIQQLLTNKQETESPITFVTYPDQNSTRYASCYTSPDKKHTLVVTADAAEILAPITAIRQSTLVLAAFIMIACVLLCYLFTRSLTKPIKVITLLLNKTSDLDLSADTSHMKYKKRKDETGRMASSLDKMRSTLHETVKRIISTSSMIQESAASLDEITTQMNTYACDNAASAEELSASMHEANSSTSLITDRIDKVNNGTVEIATQIQSAASLASSLSQNALHILKETTDSGERTSSIFKKVKADTQLALKQAESVSEINVLANSIQEIAEQTALLSLNASIEAARAGESGRGFKVVASEIGKLAGQSSDAVGHITDVVKEVHSSVTNLSDNLKTVLEFLENNVLPDYSHFISVSQSYNDDSTQVRNDMEQVNTSIASLTSNMQSIATAIAAISQTVSESSLAVGEVAKKNSEIEVLTNSTYQMVQKNEEYADTLNQLIAQFNI
ncbi:MAG: methyl-accepting chemotaxis protein [Lachnospiraceae bacterium]